MIGKQYEGLNNHPIENIDAKVSNEEIIKILVKYGISLIKNLLAYRIFDGAAFYKHKFKAIGCKRIMPVRIWTGKTSGKFNALTHGLKRKWHKSFYSKWYNDNFIRGG